MDPITMSLALLSGGLQGAQGAMSIFGQLTGNRGQKRATRMRIANLQANADMIGTQTAFDQSRLQDQVDSALSNQVSFFAGGNIDPSSGSPAVLQALSAAQGETDKMLVGARGAQKRADIYQQISDLTQGQTDRNGAMAFGIGTTMLSTLSKWAGLGSWMGTEGAFKGSGISVGSTGWGNEFDINQLG